MNPLQACTQPFSSHPDAAASDGIALRKNRSIRSSAKDFCLEIGGKFHDECSVHESLGQGGFAEVFSVVHKATGAERAVKVLAKSFNEHENDAIRREFHIVKELDHPNRIKVHHL